MTSACNAIRLCAWSAAASKPFKAEELSHVILDVTGFAPGGRDDPQCAVRGSRQGRGFCVRQEDRSVGATVLAAGARHVCASPTCPGTARPGAVLRSVLRRSPPA